MLLGMFMSDRRWKLAAHHCRVVTIAMLSPSLLSADVYEG